MGELTSLLAAVRAGEPGSIDRVVAVTYRELHSLARSRLRRAPHSTVLDTTALLHECYLRLSRVGDLKAEDRSQFMGYAARVMRSVIVDTLRERAAERRGGDQARMTLPTDVEDPAASGTRHVLEINDAIEALRLLDERLATIVELRYFAGLSNDEIAAILEVNERTVRRDWDRARAFLHRELYP